MKNHIVRIAFFVLCITPVFIQHAKYTPAIRRALELLNTVKNARPMIATFVAPQQTNTWLIPKI